MAINKYQDYLNSIMLNEVLKEEVTPTVTPKVKPVIQNATNTQTVGTLADLFGTEETTPVINTDLGSQQMNNVAQQFYEVSTAGDKRFSALNARFKPNSVIFGQNVSGRTIESVYQHGVKQGDWITDNNYKTGKPLSKVIITGNTEDDSYNQGYLPLWKLWAEQNPDLIEDLRTKSKGMQLSDKYARTKVSQARALTEILANTPSSEQLLSNLANSSKGKLLPYEGIWTRKQVAEDPNNYYVFGDNTEDRLSGYVPLQTQAVIRGLPNAIGIDTKHNRLRNADSYFTDEYGSSAEYLEHLKTQQALIDKALNEGHNVYVPVKDGKLLIGTGKAELPIRAPKTYESLRNNFNSLFKNTNTPKDLGEAQFKVISGGQTGIDILGVDEAYKLGIPTGGTIGQYSNNKYLIETQDDLIDRTKYGFSTIPVTNPRDTYLARTEQNVMNSDGTIYFKDDQDSSGYIATNRYATRHNKPFLVNPSTPEEAYNWIQQNNIRTLNIAGNRGSKVSPEMRENTRQLLYKLYLSMLNKK